MSNMNHNKFESLSLEIECPKCSNFAHTTKIAGQIYKETIRQTGLDKEPKVIQNIMNVILQSKRLKGIKSHGMWTVGALSIYKHDSGLLSR